jgi:benzodiazapine receptor
LTCEAIQPDPTTTPARAGSPLRGFAELFSWILICFAASGAGVLAVNQTLQSWYVMLRKPEWNPPNWVFGPVWTALYSMMAISAWLTWRRRSEYPVAVRFALGWFGVQLVLNALWSWVFFAWRQPGWAFLEILILWFAIVKTIFWQRRVSPTAALLMVPYLAWVTFAATLNATIWRLNP